ncbi:hypothetical protein [Psychromonas sp. SP041]|uniref:hypothetical protein n=1 Tax=Psychromonas sp. SP041 TaxID=1365007 RepID=UPI0003FC008A|nr:hypothetical protein [Psychromonas sp. SP041]
MKEYKYVITTGWWCKNLEQKDMRDVLLGDDEIRSKDFFLSWLAAVNKFTYPKKILIVDSASPIKPDLSCNDKILEIVSLDCNAGHSTNHLGKYAGVTRAHMMGMMYALTCEVDYWVYIEQDALIYGDGIVEYCIEHMKNGIMFGDGKGTPQPMQQSFMIMKTEEIPQFIKKLTDIKLTDNEISPEMKFALASSKYINLLPIFLLSKLNSKRSYMIIIKLFLMLTSRFDKLPIGYGRTRPIDFKDKFFYFQHGCKKELNVYFGLKKSEN